MGGTLSFESQVGKGTTFRVSIPDVEVAPAPASHEPPKPVPAHAAPPAPAAAPAPSPAAAVPRVLLVDDAKINLLVLKALVKKVGSFEIETAADGREALERLRRTDAPAFDAVLTDMWMPELDGEGLVKAIRADARLTALPVHVVTADVELEETYAAKGFDSILLKPVTVEALRPLFAAALPQTQE